MNVSLRNTEIRASVSAFVAQLTDLSIAQTQALIDASITNLEISQGAEKYIDAYGSITSGVTDSSDIIALAIAAAGTQGTVRLTDGKTYIIDKKVTLPIGVRFVGKGIFKRKNATVTTLSSNALISATEIDVVSASGFSVGDEFVIVNPGATNGGRGYLENSATNFGTAPQVITNITGTTITFSNGLGIACTSGWNVVKVYDMFVGAQSTTTVPGIGNVFDGIEFDGNKSNNNYTNSWAFNKTIDDLPSKTVIKNCTFHDTPGENIFISNQTQIINNNFYSCNGSAIHISQATSSNGGSIIVNGNVCRDMCLATNDVTGHSESVFTFSANPTRVIITNNDVKNCSEGFCGMNSGSPYVVVSNNIATGCKLVADIGYTGSSLVCEYFLMSNNIFKDCGYLRVFTVGSLSATDLVEKNNGSDKIQITNNIFENVKIGIQRISNYVFDNNQVVTTSGHTYSSTDALAALKASLNVTRSTHYKITNNIFDNRKVTEDSRLTAAVICEYDFNLNLALAQPIKTDASTSTEYCYYNRNVKVSGNTIKNYSLGIADYFPASEISPARSLSWINFEIANNVIESRTLKGYAIVCGPGTIVHDNKLSGNASNAALAGIIVLGVNDGSGSTYNPSGTQRLRLNGAIVYQNTVKGYATSLIVGSTNASTGNNTYGAQVRMNFIDGTTTDNTSGNSTISGNFTLVDETTPVQIVRDNAAFY